MRDFPVEGVACFVALVLVALFANIVFKKLRFPCTIGLVFVGMGRPVVCGKERQDSA